MLLPPDLLDAIEAETRAAAPRDLARAAEELTRAYREPERRPLQPPAAPAALRVEAYLTARMPATFAAALAALEELHRRAPGFAPVSQLDLCAGAGAAAWAAAEVFPSLAAVQWLDRDPAMLEAARRLAGHARSPALRAAQMAPRDLTAPGALPEADLVTLAYGLVELPAGALAPLIEAAWRAARGALALVEPGTPAGAAAILRARDTLLAAAGGGEAHLAAPCPHARRCPLEGAGAAGEAGRWCHFVQRLPRSRRHRAAKRAELGYEDEPFSYVIFTRAAPRSVPARVVSSPQINKAGARLELCDAEGRIRLERIARRDKRLYAAARKIRWGAAWTGDAAAGPDSESAPSVS